MKEKKYKILGELCPILPEFNDVPDYYWYRNELHDEPLENMSPKFYVQMSDDSIVGVYTNNTAIKIIVLFLILILIVCGGVFAYTQYSRPHVIKGTYVKSDNLHNNIVAFNAMPSVEGDKLNIMFTNGKQPATVTITGEGIVTKPTTLEAEQTLETVPVKYTTRESAVEAKLVIQTGTSKYYYPIVVEIPENQNYSGGDLNIPYPETVSENYPGSPVPPDVQPGKEDYITNNSLFAGEEIIQ